MARLVIGREDDGCRLVWQAGRMRDGLPEVDFVELRAVAEEVEPIAIRYPDVGFHWISAEFTGKE